MFAKHHAVRIGIVFILTLVVLCPDVFAARNVIFDRTARSKIAMGGEHATIVYHEHDVFRIEKGDNLDLIVTVLSISEQYKHGKAAPHVTLSRKALSALKKAHFIVNRSRKDEHIQANTITVTYRGATYTTSDFQHFTAKTPQAVRYMLGRLRYVVFSYVKSPKPGASLFAPLRKNFMKHSSYSTRELPWVFYVIKGPKNRGDGNMHLANYFSSNGDTKRRRSYVLGTNTLGDASLELKLFLEQHVEVHNFTHMTTVSSNEGGSLSEIVQLSTVGE